MTPTITVQTERFRQALRALIADSRKDSKNVLIAEARLFVRDVVKLTPPTGNSPRYEDFNTQRRFGEGAIKGDIARLYSPLASLDIVANPKTERMGKRVRKLVRMNDWRGLETLLGVAMDRPVLIVPEADKWFHREHRNSRGRVRKRAHPYLVHKVNTVKQLIAHNLKKVGYAKAGWMKAVNALKVPKIPNWIKRHTTAKGIYRAKLENTSEMSITVGNTVPHIQRSGRDLRIIERALGERVRSINIRLANAMRTRIAKANSGRRVA